MGEVEETIARRAIQAGQPIPDRIANAPELAIGLRFYLECFFDLDSERDEGPIPWSRIVGFAQYHELNWEETDDLIYFVRRLDTVISKHRIDKIKSKTEASKPKK